LHPRPDAASTLILSLGFITFCYIAACAYWPFTACRKCHGAGRHRSPSGRAWRYCHHCNGTGTRLRTGRRIWNCLRGAWKDNA
jgi:hypothetical protein